MNDEQSDNPFAAGAAYIDGRYMPIGQAAIPITDWGHRRSDVTNDAVGVWEGNFFRLNDHIRRFRTSMRKFRFEPGEGDEEIKAVLNRCVALSGLKNAYMAMDCLRGRPAPGMPYHPFRARNYIAAFAIPWVWMMSPEVQKRGGHLIIAETLRIPADSVDPTAKNFRWADLTRGQFEALDRGADLALLLDSEGHVTEGPGFDVFFVIDDVVLTPDAGVLEGIKRKSVIEVCSDLSIPAKVGKVTADEARSADEIFLATTAGAVMPVSRIDGRIMATTGPDRSRRRSRRPSGPSAQRDGTPHPSTMPPSDLFRGMGDSIS